LLKYMGDCRYHDTGVDTGGGMRFGMEGAK